MLRAFLLSAAVWTPIVAQDYFPLHVGNQWIYRQSGAGAGAPLVVEIPRTETVGGQAYSVVTGFPGGNVSLRMSADSTLYAYDRTTRREVVWAVFSTPEGGTYQTSIHECNRTAKVDARNAMLQLPIGEVINALVVSYPGATCADAGLSSDAFLPYLGLVRRSVITIAGPRTFELIYARVGGVTVLSEPEVSFSLTLDRLVYAGKLDVPVMTARLTLRVTQAEPLTLAFSSGQVYDVVFRNDKGNEVYRWSVGKVFPLALGSLMIGPGEKNHVVAIPLLQRDGDPLPPGRYVAEAWLTTTGPKTYAASVGFDIAAVR